MVTMFLLVVGIYCIAGIMVHVYYSFSIMKQQNAKHYVLHTKNEIDKLEWYYYQFNRFSKQMGVNVSITLVGDMLSHDSIQLIERWQRKDNIIRCVKVYDNEVDSDIHIHLHHTSDLNKLPF